MTIKEQFIREIAHALLSIVFEGRFADSALQRKFRDNKQWSAEEKSVAAKTLYSLLRNWRRAWYTIRREETNDVVALERLILMWMRLQGVNLHSMANGLPYSKQDLQERWSSLDDTDATTFALRMSLPDWLAELCNREIGDTFPSIAEALLAEPTITVRTNTLRTSVQELRALFDEQGIRTTVHDVFPDAIFLEQYHNVFATTEFKNGLFEVQDAGSQLIAPFVQAEAGMRVVDACAGSGGKALHLAACMQNKGRILALDTEAWKLNALMERSRRAGASIIETRAVNTTKVIKRLHDSADRVLLDVPCSGLGVLRRNPDTKWHLSNDTLRTLRSTQQEILRRYSLMVKPSGKLVYATCSILPSENEEQVRWFIANNHGWELEEERRISPADYNSDGFYMARLRRIGLSDND
ncbi:MAG: RNA methyltransferase [Candidatus Kapabacteria bacterium]|nr:RNA methyltransferase [Candidatus Kapabacteria bacterium]